MEWWQILLIVLLAIWLLGIVLSPFGTVAKFVLTLLSVVVEIVYVVLIWWWLAILRKILGYDVPRIWLFGKH